MTLSTVIAIETLTISQAARRIGVHPETLRRGIRNGTFTIAKNCGLKKWVVPVPLLEKYLNETGVK